MTTDIVQIPAFEPRRLTIMFVDVVGFSLVAESRDPQECFADLQRILSAITSCVVRHGGKVDKVLGDGVLSYFGGDLALTALDADQARAALACALEIQRENLDTVLKAHLKGAPIYPLRIGINTSEVLLGHVADGLLGHRTVIGHGVNLANRLEAACDGFSIMVGCSTMVLLNAEELRRLDVTPRQRLIQIKHHDEFMEAHECNPFDRSPESLSNAIEAYRTFLQVKRQDDRWPVPPESRVRIISPVGIGELVDFSLRGIGVKFPVFLGKGVSLNLTIEFPDKEFNEYLERERLSPLVGEVRWARPSQGNSYLHGMFFQFSGRASGERLVSVFKEFLSKDRTGLPLASI